MIFVDGWLITPLMHRIGWTLLHSLWQGTVAAMLLAVVLRVLPMKDASRRYLIALSTLFLIVLLAVVTFVTAPSHATWFSGPASPRHCMVGVGEGLGASGSSAGAVVPMKTSLEMPVARSALDRLLPMVGNLWLLGVFLMSARLLIGWVKTHRLTTRWVCPLEDEWDERVNVLAERLGVRRSLRLFTSTRIDVPTVVGWLKPCLLLPTSALMGLSPAQLEAVLAHELAHIRRHDYIVNLIQSVFETLFFYHPAVWWISERIRDEREHCCDDVAVAVCGSLKTYAKALTELEHLRVTPYQLAMGATGGTMLNRIRRLLNLPLTSPDQGPKWLAGAVVMVTAITLSTSAGATRSEDGGKDSQTNSTSTQALATQQGSSESVSNPSFSGQSGSSAFRYPALFQAADYYMSRDRGEVSVARLQSAPLEATSAASAAEPSLVLVPSPEEAVRTFELEAAPPSELAAEEPRADEPAVRAAPVAPQPMEEREAAADAPASSESEEATLQALGQLIGELGGEFLRHADGMSEELQDAIEDAWQEAMEELEAALEEDQEEMEGGDDVEVSEEQLDAAELDAPALDASALAQQLPDPRNLDRSAGPWQTQPGRAAPPAPPIPPAPEAPAAPIGGADLQAALSRVNDAAAIATLRNEFGISDPELNARHDALMFEMNQLAARARALEELAERRPVAAEAMKEELLAMSARQQALDVELRAIRLAYEALYAQAPEWYAEEHWTDEDAPGSALPELELEKERLATELSRMDRERERMEREEATLERELAQLGRQQDALERAKESLEKELAAKKASPAVPRAPATSYCPDAAPLPPAARILPDGSIEFLIPGPPIYVPEGYIPEGFAPSDNVGPYPPQPALPGTQGQLPGRSELTVPPTWIPVPVTPGDALRSVAPKIRQDVQAMRQELRTELRAAYQEAMDELQRDLSELQRREAEDESSED